VITTFLGIPIYAFIAVALGVFGSNPLELLRQGIGGYSRPSLRPLPTGEYYPGMDQP